MDGLRRGASISHVRVDVNAVKMSCRRGGLADCFAPHVGCVRLRVKGGLVGPTISRKRREPVQ